MTYGMTYGQYMHHVHGLSNVSSLKMKPSNWYHKYQQADAHVEAWRDRTITVKLNGMGFVPKDSLYIAWYGDYDLGCKVGYGATSEAAIEDLKWAMEG